MHALPRFLVSSLIAGMVLCSVPLTDAACANPRVENADAISCPSVTLENWRNSSKQEKLSFLLGFASLLELEKEWQHTKTLPIRQSIIGSWVRGLDGVTIGEMNNSLDQYAAANPDKKDISVLAVLGSIYVRPKLTKPELAAAAKRAEEIKAKQR